MNHEDPTYPLPLLGWREWIALPDLKVDQIKVKVDTGARSSAIHASDIKYFEVDQQQWVRFKIHPYQKDTTHTILTEAPLLATRSVRSSNGHIEDRPIIQTTIDLGMRWLIELTLTNRDLMGFRMLIGRQAIRQRFWVDPGRSYLHTTHLPPHLKSAQT